MERDREGREGGRGGREGGREGRREGGREGGRKRGGEIMKEEEGGGKEKRGTEREEGECRKRREGERENKLNNLSINTQILKMSYRPLLHSSTSCVH